MADETTAPQGGVESGVIAETDPPVWDADRAMRTIKHLRERESQLEAALREARGESKSLADKVTVRDQTSDAALKAMEAELAAAREQVGALSTEMKTLRVSRQIEATARSLNAVDADVIVRLVDPASIEVDEQGVVKNAEEVVRAILTARPYLVAGGYQSNPARGGGGALAAEKQNELKRLLSGGGPVSLFGDRS